ncbi:MAG TPA: TIGR03067 domain-containing protein, partial [Gemmataceae bacterium]|nr:TIGR03067 domain-containing protein [Gemmataceae bacterium]
GDEKADELKKFQGRWRVLRMEDDTKYHELAKMLVEIKGKTWIFHNSENMELSHTFSIDPAAKPKTIDWTMTLKKGGDKTTILGIYTLEGNQIKLCFSDPGGENPARPKQFRASKGSLLMILEKKK